MGNIYSNILYYFAEDISLYKNRNFLLLIQGKFVSVLGNSIFSIGIIWHLLTFIDQDRSGLFLGIFYSCSLIPSIFFGPLSGVWVDKLNRKLIIVGVDLIKGSLFILLGVLTYLNIFPLVSLFVVAAVCAYFTTFFDPAVNAMIPNIVKPENLLKANSLSGICYHLPNIIGMGIAGILYYKIGIIGILLINGTTFISKRQFEPIFYF